VKTPLGGPTAWERKCRNRRSVCSCLTHWKTGRPSCRPFRLKGTLLLVRAAVAVASTSRSGRRRTVATEPASSVASGRMLMKVLGTSCATSARVPITGLPTGERLRKPGPVHVAGRIDRNSVCLGQLMTPVTGGTKLLRPVPKTTTEGSGLNAASSPGPLVFPRAAAQRRFAADTPANHFPPTPPRPRGRETMTGLPPHAERA
jgi:hypothetical protein